MCNTRTKRYCAGFFVVNIFGRGSTKDPIGFCKILSNPHINYFSCDPLS